MSQKKNMINSLGTLVQLRGIEVDRLQADLASQEATRTRYTRNLERLNALAEIPSMKRISLNYLEDIYGLPPMRPASRSSA